MSVVLFSVKHKLFLAQGMAESDQKICQSVIDIFVVVCSSVIDGTVTLQVLDKIEKQKSRMSSLCEAITSKPTVGKDPKLTESLCDWQSFSFMEIKMAIDKRRREYRAFEVYHQHLHHLFTHLKDLSIQGWNE